MMKSLTTWVRRFVMLALAVLLAGIAWVVHEQYADFDQVSALVKDWKVVVGKIERVEFETLEHPGGKRYVEARATYTYTHGGKAYRSARVYHDPVAARASRRLGVFHPELQEAARRDRPVDVHVNPRDPSEAALFVLGPRSTWVETALVGFIAFAAIVLVALVVFDIACPKALRERWLGTG